MLNRAKGAIELEMNLIYNPVSDLAYNYFKFLILKIEFFLSKSVKGCFKDI